MTAPYVVVTRFAPSPTGPLHLGHALSAVLGHALARRTGGRWLVRLDDLDRGRWRPAHEAGILADLAWLGLEPDAPPTRQSERHEAYARALDALDEQGLVYACTCTRADMAAAVAAPHEAEVRAYDGRCRDRRPGATLPPFALRLHLGRAGGGGVERWPERGVARASARADREGDPVLRRKDGAFAYHLATVVDDAAMGVTLVVRGQDLAPATGLQRLLQRLLGLPQPSWLHHPLVLGADGRRLAKRDRAAALHTLRATGADGRALARDLVAAHEGLLGQAMRRMERAGPVGDAR